MEPNPNEELLFKAVQRVIAAKEVLDLALAEYRRIYAAIAGKPPVGVDIDELLSGSEDGFAKRTIVGGRDKDISNPTVLSTLSHDGPRLGIRDRVREFLRQRSPRCFTAETISKALGIKISSTRYELYQLRKEKVVEKVGIDQWRFADSEDLENQHTDPKGNLSTSTESNEKPNPPVSGGNETFERTNLPPAPQDGDRWHAVWQQADKFFRENKGKEYSTDQITKILGPIRSQRAKRWTFSSKNASS